jgi:signal transduction histidine kinase
MMCAMNATGDDALAEERSDDEPAERARESAQRTGSALEREVAQRLRALDELKNTILEAVSHELRTPLTAVLGFAEILQREDWNISPEDRRDFVRRIAANAGKLDRLLADLLDLDRLSRGVLQVRRRPTDLGALARRIVEQLELPDDREVRVEAGPVVAHVDPTKVERIVENLLANAIKHTPAGTAVLVLVRPERDGVLFAVEDAGPGVSWELREAVFEPFRHGPGAPRHSPGLGLGLSLVARLAELHGGRAWAEERRGGGASFRVFLPNVSDGQGGETRPWARAGRSRL